MKINDTEKYVNGLAVLDTETGMVGKIDWMKDIAYCIAKGYAKDILILDAKGLYDYGLSDGSKQYYMVWSGTAYDPQSGAEDIKFISDNQIEIYAGGDMTVTLSKINPEESGKTILTYKTTSISSEIKELIVRFNKENPDYYIVIEECPASQDLYTFREKVEIEIAAGHGPDMIDNLSVRNPYTLIEKGVLEELTLYIEESGMDREAYFPMVFQGFGVEEGVYGIGIGMSIHSWCADGSLFSKEEDFSLEHMVNVLEVLNNDKIFMNGREAVSLVYQWLRPSEDLYGMVDWETGECDFSGENFRRIL
ncbi:MAG: extracellular solute-binding protein, partial [Lachnospiraceae bacterium]|nr:extracellular solute-binding protein [Lachnospiraceae bacterium]